MTTIERIAIKDEDDPLGYSEKDMKSRLLHIAEDAIKGVNEDAVDKEVSIVTQHLRQAGRINHGKVA